MKHNQNQKENFERKLNSTLPPNIVIEFSEQPRMDERATRLGERTRLVEENNQEEELEDSEMEDSEVEEVEWEDWEERRYQNLDRITITCSCVIVAYV